MRRKLQKNKDVKVFLAIYLLTLAFMLHYSLTHPVINDGVYEYRSYLLNIKEGWLYRYSAINSCLVSIWFPAMLQKMTGLDPMTLYRVFPPLFYALVPAFTYLITRRYLGTQEAAMASLVVSLSSYILFFPDIGRVGVALGILSGLIWALLSKKLLTSLVLSALLVYAHYGTTIVATGLLVAILAGRLIWDKSLIRVTVVSLCTLLVLAGAWHFGISHYSGDSMLWTILHPREARGVLESYIPGVRVDVPEGDFLELESRDYITQEAFGLHFATNSTPLKIEIIVNWIVVGFITLGLYLNLRRRDTEMIFRVILATMYGLTVVSVVLPSISVFYGTQRVWFTSMLALASCFPVGIHWLARRTRVPPAVLATIVLTTYGASTSGLIYPLFGLTKSMPVVLTLP